MDAGFELDFGAGGGAFGEEQRDDVAGAAVAEELAEGFFVVGDAVLLDERDEVLRGIAREGRTGEVRVFGEIVFGRGVEVGEVGAASAGDEDLGAGTVGVVEDEGAAVAFGGFDGGHEAGGAGSEDDDVVGAEWGH